MDLVLTGLPGVISLVPRRHSDDRGWMSETWNARTLVSHGIDVPFVQDNESHSARKGTLRGLHYQAPPHAQTKLVRCVSGAILDVAVDVRRGSPTWGRWAACVLSAEGGEQLLIPEGFLHGFLTLAPDTRVAYKCSAHYAPHAEGAVRWDSVGIDWGAEVPPTGPFLSPKDAEAPPFDAWQSPFHFGAASP